LKSLLLATSHRCFNGEHQWQIRKKNLNETSSRIFSTIWITHTWFITDLNATETGGKWRKGTRQKVALQETKRPFILAY
jgi:hypothetical protein